MSSTTMPLDQLTAHVVSIPAAFLLSGYGIASSQNILPLLYDLPPSTATHLFSGVFHRGLTPVITGVALTVSASGYLAHTNPTQRRLYTAAALLPIAALGLTQLVMMPGISRLLQLGEVGRPDAGGAGHGEVLRLLKAWARLNYVRAALYFSSGVAALWPTIVHAS